jgi:hypothetical protein
VNDDLDRLADLHQGTTPGPWYQFGWPWFEDELGVLAGSNDPHVATFVADLTPLDALLDPLDDEDGKWAKNPNDAEFIVEMHRLLPRLATELRAAREVVNQARLQSRPHARLRKALTAHDQAVGGGS